MKMNRLFVGNNHFIKTKSQLKGMFEWIHSIYSTYSWFITGRWGHGFLPGWMGSGKWSEKWICAGECLNLSKWYDVGLFDTPHLVGIIYMFDGCVFRKDSHQSNHCRRLYLYTQCAVIHLIITSNPGRKSRCNIMGDVSNNLLGLRNRNKITVFYERRLGVPLGAHIQKALNTEWMRKAASSEQYWIWKRNQTCINRFFSHLRAAETSCAHNFGCGLIKLMWQNC